VRHIIHLNHMWILKSTLSTYTEIKPAKCLQPGIKRSYKSACFDLDFPSHMTKHWNSFYDFTLHNFSYQKHKNEFWQFTISGGFRISKGMQKKPRVGTLVEKAWLEEGWTMTYSYDYLTLEHQSGSIRPNSDIKWVIFFINICFSKLISGFHTPFRPRNALLSENVWH